MGASGGGRALNERWGSPPDPPVDFSKHTANLTAEISGCWLCLSASVLVGGGLGRGASKRSELSLEMKVFSAGINEKTVHISCGVDYTWGTFRALQV